MTLAPNHVAIIMDGNRRWAKEHGVSARKGHEAGAENLKKIAFYAFDKGVKVFSVYAFSTENWQRTKEEVGGLMGLVIKSFDKHFDEFDEKDIKIMVLGDLDSLPANVNNVFSRATEKTKNNKKAIFAICFNYGGRQEIIQAISKLKNTKVSEGEFAKYLYGGNEIPDIDLLIRTSGEERISNFMLWRLAYSEIIFNNNNWPDFNENEFDKAIDEFNNRQRRYGE